MRTPTVPSLRAEDSSRGFALFFIMALCLGLTTVVLLYAGSASMEYRGSGNAVGSVQARQTMEGAQRYLAYVLDNLDEPGYLPEVDEYEVEQVPVGDGTFWILGRDSDDDYASTPYYSLVDEGSKLNLNTATLEMIEAVPGMTAEFAAAIIDWRDEDSDLTAGGAESENYALLNDAYLCKNAAFESVYELRLVYGADWDKLIGEDTNQNHLLDENENDGDQLPPDDNQDGLLDRGLFAYFTVHSAEPNVDPDGEARVDINGNETDTLERILAEKLSDSADTVMQAIEDDREYTSVLEFFYAISLSVEDFAIIEPYLTVSEEETLTGLINVNTAPEEVLACVPGIGTDHAHELVAERSGKSTTELQSIGWVGEVLDETAGLLAGPYLTTRCYRLSADILAVGANGRGFGRARYIFDTSGDETLVVARHDLSRNGWPLDEDPRLLVDNDRIKQ